jgi:hypothetical protein
VLPHGVLLRKSAAGGTRCEKYDQENAFHVELLSVELTNCDASSF